VAETADVNAQVTAGSVSVAGHLQGNIGCRGRFEILPTGRVEARVQAASIVVQEGARYEGEMRMGSAAGERSVSVDVASPRRSDGRQARRTGAAGSSEVPSFSVSSGRTNGRATPDNTPGSLPLSDRPDAAERPTAEN
jgi:hypothetical protein